MHCSRFNVKGSKIEAHNLTMNQDTGNFTYGDRNPTVILTATVNTSSIAIAPDELILSSTVLNTEEMYHLHDAVQDIIGNQVEITLD